MNFIHNTTLSQPDGCQKTVACFNSIYWSPCYHMSDWQWVLLKWLMCGGWGRGGFDLSLTTQPISMQTLDHTHPCKSHDHDYKWADWVMTLFPWEKRKCEHKVVILMWDFDCLYFAQYISISPHDIGCKQPWCRKIHHMNRASWLNPLTLYKFKYLI